MNNGMGLAALLVVLVCLGCSDHAALDHDLTGTWEVIDAACMSDLSPEDLGLPAGLPPEALEQVRQLLDPARLEDDIEGPIRVVQTGDMLEIFDVEETGEAEAFSGTVTGGRLEYSLSQDDVHIEGEGVIVSPDRLEIDHLIAFEMGQVQQKATVSCGFET